MAPRNTSPRAVLALVAGIVCGALVLMALYHGFVRGDGRLAGSLVAVAGGCGTAIATALSRLRGSGCRPGG